MDKVNGKLVVAFLDTGHSKSIVHPQCVQESEYLPWWILYATASA